MYTFSERKNDWLWRLADGRYYSTRENNYVDQAYADAWLLRSGLTAVPLSPPDEQGAHSEQGLREALVFYGLPLGALANTEELIAAFMGNIQARLDNFAKARGYDGILSAASYASDPNPSYAAEGQYCVTARSQTWDWCNAYLNAVLAGEKPLPAWEAFAAELEAAVPLAWPVEDIRAK